MALSKTIEVDDTGIAAQYWRISEIGFTWPLGLDSEQGPVAQIIVVTLLGYVSEAARQAGKRHIDQKSVTFHSTVQDTVPPSLSRSDAYALLARSGEFAGAEPC